MSRIHKRFTSGQVKELLERYEKSYAGSDHGNSSIMQMNGLRKGGVFVLNNWV